MIYACEENKCLSCDAPSVTHVIHPAAFKKPIVRENRRMKSPEGVNLVFNYGPYSCDGVIKHRRIRLKGLVRKLQEKFLKICISYKPNDIYDRLTVTLDDHVMYECKITNMSCDGDCTDRTSREGYKAIKSALTRILDIEDRYHLGRNPNALLIQTF